MQGAALNLSMLCIRIRVRYITEGGKIIWQHRTRLSGSLKGGRHGSINAP